MQAIVTSGAVAGAAGKTLLSILANARRLRLKQLIIGCVDTPADTNYSFGIFIITVNGTGTSLTPQWLDGAQAAINSPTAGAESNYTVEPTYDSNSPIATFPLYQKNTIIWEPPQDGEPVTQTSGESFIGFGIRQISGSTDDIAVTAIWEE